MPIEVLQSDDQSQYGYWNKFFIGFKFFPLSGGLQPSPLNIKVDSVILFHFSLYQWIPNFHIPICYPIIF